MKIVISLLFVLVVGFQPVLAQIPSPGVAKILHEQRNVILGSSVTNCRDGELYAFSRTHEMRYEIPLFVDNHPIACESGAELISPETAKIALDALSDCTRCVVDTRP